MAYEWKWKPELTYFVSAFVLAFLAEVAITGAPDTIVEVIPLLAAAFGRAFSVAIQKLFAKVMA